MSFNGEAQVAVEAQSRVRQYLKEGKAFRIETVVNKPWDLGVLARICHFPELVDKARQINRRLLMIERAGQECAIGSALFERIQLPYVREGHRTGALRFGDIRVMALTGALCVFVHCVSRFTNKSLKCVIAGLLDVEYTASQMSYDLRRLRLHGLIERIPRTNTYTVTSEGMRTAVFYSKVHSRVLRPLMAADAPPATTQLRRALGTIDKTMEDYVNHARIGIAAREKLVTLFNPSTTKSSRMLWWISAKFSRLTTFGGYTPTRSMSRLRPELAPLLPRSRAPRAS